MCRVLCILHRMTALPQAYCMLNGRLVRAEEALVSVQDRGFRYGDGVFETIAVHGGVPWRFEQHSALAKSWRLRLKSYSPSNIMPSAPC